MPLRAVADPALLEQLETAEPATPAPARSLRPVSDPSLLSALNSTPSAFERAEALIESKPRSALADSSLYANGAQPAAAAPQSALAQPSALERTWSRMRSALALAGDAERAYQEAEAARPAASADAMRVIGRLPETVSEMASGQAKSMLAGGRRARADLALRANEGLIERGVSVSPIGLAEPGQEPLYTTPEQAAVEAHLETIRANRAQQRAQEQMERAIPEDAGAVEKALIQGLGSAAITVPIVTAGALVPGGQVPALIALGGASAASRYGELRTAGIDEGSAALSAAYLGSLEALTEKIPLGTLAKKSPFLRKAAEFLVTDIAGENISSAAQLADDYRLQLRDDVTMQDFQDALKETTAATIVGAGAQLSVSGLMDLVINRANGLAQARAGAPDLRGPTPEEIDAGVSPPEVDLSQIEDESLSDAELERQIKELEDEETGEAPAPQASRETPAPPLSKEQQAQRKIEEIEWTFDPEELSKPIAPGSVAVKPSAKREGWFTIEVDGKPLTHVSSRETADAVAADLIAATEKPQEAPSGEPLPESGKPSTATAAPEAAAQATVLGQPVEAPAEPTEAQKESGTYRKPPVKWNGLTIRVENLKGSTRSGKDASGKAWSRVMPSHYGYFSRTEAKDGDAVDAYIGENPQADTVFVIDQLTPDGTRYDEAKVVVGVESEDAARKLYLANYPRGWKGLGAITPMPIERFKEWVRSPATKRPVAWRPPIDYAGLRADATASEFAVNVREEFRAGSQSAKNIVQGFNFYIEQTGISRDALAPRVVEELRKMKRKEALAAADMIESEAAKEGALLSEKPRAVEFTGEELGGISQPIAKLKTKAREFARRTFANKSVVNESDGSMILIPWQAIKHATTGQVSSGAALAIAKLDRVLETGQRIETVPDKSGRSGIRAVHYYDTEIAIAGRPATIRSVVREHTDGRRYYDHFELRKEESPAPGGAPKRWPAQEDSGASGPPSEPGDRGKVSTPGKAASTEEDEPPASQPARRRSTEAELGDTAAVRRGLADLAADPEEHRSQVERAVHQALQSVKRTPKVSVLPSILQVPEAVKRQYARQFLNLSVQRARRIEGLYHPPTGEVFIFADVVQTPARALWVLFHELAGHGGVRRAAAQLGVPLEQLFDRAAKNSTVRALAAEIAKQRSIWNPQRAADEALAELAAAVRTGDYAHIKARYGLEVPTAQRATLAGAIRRLIQRMKAAIAKAFGLKTDAFSDADVYGLLEYGWKNIEQPRPAAGSKERAPRFSRALDTLTAEVNRLETEVDAAFERGDIELAEELDAQLAEKREQLTSVSEAISEDEESFEMEAGLEEQLVVAYDAYLQMKNGQPYGPFNDRGGAIANMRDAIELAGGKPGTDADVLEAARDIYDAVLARRDRRAVLSEAADPRRARLERLRAERDRRLAAQAGAGYVPMYQGGQVVPLQATAVTIGAGATARALPIPTTPIRREHIMALLQREFGAKVYQGKPFKGRRMLGFFRPSNFEVRVKHKNDLEVTAHEIFHWLDYTYPELRRLYREKRFDQELRSISYDAKKLHEGFAEFGRLFLTQDAQAIAKVPQFYAAFTQSAKQLGLYEQLAKVQDRMHQWYMQGALARARSKIGTEAEPLEQRLRALVDVWSDRATSESIDHLHAAKVIERELAGDIAKDALDSPYKTLRLLAGARSTIESFLNFGTLNWTSQGLEFTGKSLKHVFEPVAHVMDDTLAYFVGRRAQELMKYGKERLFTPDEVEALLNAGRQSPAAAEIDRAFDEYQAYVKRLMDFAQASGIVSRETRQLWEAMYQNYVPFYRVQESLAGNRTLGGPSISQPFKRLFGGTANVRDIWENIVLNTATVVHASLRNQAKRKLFDAIEKSPLGQRFAVRIPTETMSVKVGMTQVEQVLRSMVQEALDRANAPNATAADKMHYAQVAQALNVLTGATNAAGGAALDAMQSQATFYVGGQPPSIPDKDSVLVDGERRWFQIADPLFWDMLSDINAPKPIGLIEAVFGMFKRTLTRGVTITPEFQIANIFRDTLNAFTMSKGGQIPFVHNLRAMADAVVQSEDYRLFLANGGGFGNATPVGEGRRVRLRMNKLVGPGVRINIRAILDTPAKVIDFWDRWGQAFEIATRLAEFKRLRSKGVSLREAAFEGREISSDFAMHGRAAPMRFAMMSLPFFNARMQGLYRLERELFERRGRQSWRGDRQMSYAIRGFLGITMPALILYWMNKDDEDYEALSEETKSLYYAIKIPNTHDFVLIPRPFETGTIFGTVPEQLWRYYETRNEKKLMDAASFLLLNTFAMNPMPQIGRPPLEWYANKDWRGLPIVPFQLENVEPSEQYKWNTSASMIEAGKLFDVSPIALEHFLRGYLGGVGSYLTMASDSLVTAGRYGEDPARRLQDYPVLRRFIREYPYTSTSQARDFWDLKQEVDRTVNTARKIREELRGDDLEQYLGDSEKAVLFGMARLTDRVAERVRTISAAQIKIRMDPQLSGEEKRRQIDELQAEMNSLFKEVMKTLTVEELERYRDALEGQRPQASAGERLETIESLIADKPRRQQFAALRSGGYPATAELLAALPTTPDREALQFFESETA